MPTTAPLAPGPFERLRRGYGAGPFSQMMLNMDLAPLPASLIDLTGGPETWLKAIRSPIDPDPETRLYHGVMGYINPLLEHGLKRGWFGTDLTNTHFGPNFLEAKFKDLPQPVIKAPRSPFMKKYDPLIEYSPAWGGYEKATRELSRIEDVAKKGSTKFGASPRSLVKDVQHEIATPEIGKEITIPLEKFSFVNPEKNIRIPQLDKNIFQKLMRTEWLELPPDEQEAILSLLK